MILHHSVFRYRIYPKGFEHYSKIIQTIVDLSGSCATSASITIHWDLTCAEPQESQKDSCTEHRLGH